MRAALLLLPLLGLSALLPDPGPPLPELVLVQQQGKASLWVEKRRRHPLNLKLSDTLIVVVRVDSHEPVEVNETEKMVQNDGLWLQVLYQPAEGSEVKHWQKVYRVTPLRPGTHALKLPSLRVTQGEDQDVTWAPLTLRITTRVAKADISEARDITLIEEVPAPAAMPETRLTWLWWLAPVPLVAALAVWLLRRRSRGAKEPLPHEVFLRHLQELERQPTDTAELVERWHTRLSDLLRWFLEKQLNLPATRQTTPEFFLALQRGGQLPQEQQARLNEVLAQCDLAKFARVVPGHQDCLRLVGAARDLAEVQLKKATDEHG
jgi:hypothetical protein